MLNHSRGVDKQALIGYHAYISEQEASAMTLQQLIHVVAITESGSFSRAAEKLMLSQPSLTSSIRELEKEIDIIIFNRTRKGVTLTADGMRFLPYARSVLETYQRLLDVYGKQGVRRQKFAVSTQHYSFAVKAFVELTRAYDVAEYDFAIRETRTRDVIADVASARSEIGILYLNDFNRRSIGKLLTTENLSFHPLITCQAYVYLWRGHPLADRPSISFQDLLPYPCLSFEQGENSGLHLSEEILSSYEYPRIIKVCDRATALNLMVGVLGYTLCSGIICEELNGSDYIAVPYIEETPNPDSSMEIGYLTRHGSILSPTAHRYLNELRRYLSLPLLSSEAENEAMSADEDKTANK